MFSKKYAFTLVEILIVFVIIGIIIVLEMHILQAQLNQYSAPYYNAYNTLSKAAYNVQADIYCPDNTKPVAQQICPNGPRDFPTTSEGLCNRLKEFVNTAPNQGNCKATEINDNSNNGDQFDDKHIKFVASNSFRYYITGLKHIDCANSNSSSNKQLCAGTTSNNVDYFVVYVDINGEKKPNRVGMNPNDEIYPDIVPFAVTTMGEVAPMGYPIYSPIYLTAKIKYPQVEKINPDTGEILGFTERRSSASMDYFSAVIGAWGGGFNSEIVDSILFTEKMNDKFPGKSFYTAKKITNYKKSGNTYSVLSDGETKKIHFDNHNPPVETTRRCTAGTFDCEVIVDSTLNKRY